MVKGVLPVSIIANKITFVKGAIKIYECENGHLFDEPAQQVEDEGFDTEIGHRAVKVIYEVCPYCGTDCFESYNEDYDEF